MPSISIPKLRRQEKRRAFRVPLVGGHWRWLVPVLAALAAVVWRVRGVFSNHDARTGDDGLSLKTSSSGLTSAPAGAPANGGGEPDPMGPELLTSAPADAAEEWGEPSADEGAESAESSQLTGDAGASNAGAAESGASGDTVPAGEDESGTFRPTRASTDDYGVTVKDEAPAGLAASNGWIRGDGSASCPESHPIKGNASSRIFHRPGESSYEATIPELCFENEEAAVAAGYRPRAR